MNIYGMGEFLLNLREERGLTQEELAYGICKPRQLSKIETGERLPDAFLLDCLMSRLGKSADKLEYVVSEESYAFYEMRAEIEGLIEDGDIKRVEEKIAIYEGGLDRKEHLHFQYLDMLRALLLWDNEENREECILWLESAMDRTMPFWRKNNYFEYSMSWLEAGLLVLWAEKSKEKKELEEFLEKMLHYAKEQWDDKEERVKIYPYIVKTFGKQLEKQKRYEELEMICSRGIELLVENNTLANLTELLELEIRAAEQIKKDKEEIERRKRQKECLEELCKKYGYRGSRIGLFSRMKKELYLDWEIIRKQRMVLGITQEKLCEDICSQETLARIEHGRRPHNKNYRKITEKILWKKEKRSNTINIWDYEVLKLKSEVSAFIETYRYCEAKERLLSFPFQETVESQQYFMYTKAVLEMQLKEIKEEEAIKIFEEALFMTLSIKNFEKLSQCVLTSQEVIILNGIAIAYAQMGQRKVAVKLYEKILEGYENSKIIPQFKSKEISIILRNMAGYLEGLDKFDEALQTFEKAMNFVFQCGTMCEVSELLANAAYTLERKGKRKEGSGMLIQAYFISDLVNCEKIRKIVRMHYEEVYKKI